MKKQNRVLRQLTFQIYQKRPATQTSMRTNYRIEHVNGGLLCDLWFLTIGCSHDRRGGCTMCNYGKSEGYIDQCGILEELTHIVETLPFEFEDFLLTPSGSMLDPTEVPIEMREAIAALLQNIKTKRFIIETRADTVTQDGLEFLKRILPDAQKYVEIGVETSNNWISNYCVNKNSTYEIFKRAMDQIHKEGMFVTANIGLGIPFLSEHASIQDAITSIRTVLNDGADSVVLFPYHIKEGTLLEIMQRQGLYDCVSLWALVEVLSAFSPRELRNIQISWYKDYFGAEYSHILSSPGTCPHCKKEVLRLLDEYRDTQNPDLILKLNNYTCQCRQLWRKKVGQQSPEIDISAVSSAYTRLAEEFSLDSEMVSQEIAAMQHDFVRT